MNSDTRAQVRALISDFMERWIADNIPAEELERIFAPTHLAYAPLGGTLSLTEEAAEPVAAWLNSIERGDP